MYFKDFRQRGIELKTKDVMTVAYWRHRDCHRDRRIAPAIINSGTLRSCDMLP